MVFATGVLPPERRAAQRPGRPGRPQPADGERGEGVLRGAVPSPQAAEGGRDGQTGPEGHAGLGPGTETTNDPAESDWDSDSSSSFSSSLFFFHFSFSSFPLPPPPFLAKFREVSDCTCEKNKERVKFLMLFQVRPGGGVIDLVEE